MTDIAISQFTYFKHPYISVYAYKAVALLCLFALACYPSVAQEAEEDSEWSIEESRAPSTSRLSFEADEGTWISIDISPHGDRLAFDLLGHIYEMPVEGGNATALTGGRSWNMFPRYSPDGSKLAFTSDRGGSDDIWILELGTDSLRNLTDSDEPTYQPSWSTDGSAIYAASFTQGAKNKAHLYSLIGGSQQLLETGVFEPVNHFQEDLRRGVVYFEINDQRLYSSGARIGKYDLKSGKTEDHRVRPGGAFNPALSPDGRYLAYVHRDDQETVLVLQDLETDEERVIVRGLDRDHQGYRAYFYGLSPNVAWHPDARSIFLAFGGKIRRVDIDSGQLTEIPFTAPVDRELDETIRFPIEIPRGTQTTLANRFPVKTDDGIFYEALGDIYIYDDGNVRNLTNSTELETSPIYDHEREAIYYASWSDSSLGHLFRLDIASGDREQLTSLGSQYSSLSLSTDGRHLAFVRGREDIRQGARLNEQTDFELITLELGGDEGHVTDLTGTPGAPNRAPLSTRFDPAGDYIYYTEFATDTLVLSRITPDGLDKKALYRFPHGDAAVLSPDFKWIAFQEYARIFVTPFEFVGKTVTVSAFDKTGFTQRVDEEGGLYVGFTPEGSAVTWSRGGTFFEKSIDDILNDGGEVAETEIAVPYKVAQPSTLIALTGVRVVTMNEDREVIENATILVDGNRISAIGSGIDVPDDAEVFDLHGHTVIPGMIDAHGHYLSTVSLTNVVEQRQAPLAAALAHGVTTLYELYGSFVKDSWTMDMLRSGKTVGSRLLSTGPPIYGLRFFRPNTYRPIQSIDDAREQVELNQEYGATALKDYVNFKRIERHQLVTAARELGMNVVSETAGNAPLNFTQVIDGVTGLEHSMGLTPLYQDVIELFQASEVGVTPTLLVVYNGPAGQSYFNQSERLWENEKLLRFVRPDMLLPFRRVTHYWSDDLYAPEMAAEMKKLFDAGVLINMGGHGQMYGLDAHWELELFVQGGFSPHEALETATINSATYHGLDADLGSLEPGKISDLIVLSENPLDDIKNTQSIVYVMQNGVVYAGEDAARIYPNPQPAAKIYYLDR